MADKRKPQCRIIIEESRRRVSVELFPASLFPGGERLDGHYRARVGRRWLRPGGHRYQFWTKPEILAWLWWLADGRPDLTPPSESAPVAAPATEPRPDLERGCRRRLLMGRAEPDGTPLYEAVVAMTDPFQGPDGRWWVFLVGRRVPVLTSSLTTAA